MSQSSFQLLQQLFPPWGPLSKPEEPRAGSSCHPSATAAPGLRLLCLVGWKPNRNFLPSPSLASDQVLEQQPGVPRSQQVQLLWGWWQGRCPGVPSRDTREGFVIPVHSQIPGGSSIQGLPCSPSKGL